MNAIEANQLLAHAAAFDNRKQSDAAAQAWAAALHDIPLDADALAAVARFYGTDDPQATGQRWIQPHHVRTHRKAIRNERLAAMPTPAPHHALAEADYRKALKNITRQIGDGKTPFRALAAPEGSAEPSGDYRALRQAYDEQRTAELEAAAERQRAETEAEAYARMVAEAYGYLLAIDGEAANDAFARAREQLGITDELDDPVAGTDARHRLVLLAAELAQAKPLTPAAPDKATVTFLAVKGCPYGCPLGEHIRPCVYAEV